MMHPHLQARVMAALNGITNNSVLRALLFELTQVNFVNTQEEYRLHDVVNAQGEEIRRLRLEILVLQEQDQAPE